MSSEMNINGQRNKAIWIGVAVGTAVGIGLALSRNSRRRDPWASARALTKKVASHSSDVSEATRDMVDRVRTIYEESCKLIEDAGELWAQGRKLVGI